MATTPAIAHSAVSTKNFLLFHMSSAAAHSGLSDQAMPMLAVASVISLSLWPRSLNRVPATQITSANGMPSAKYAVGTQAAGPRCCGPAAGCFARGAYAACISELSRP